MPKRREMRVAVSAAASEPAAPSEKTSPMSPGREVELAHGEHEEDRERDAREEVRGRRAARLRTKVRIPEDEAESLLELGPDARLAPVDRRRLRPRLLACGCRAMKRPDARKLSASRRTAYGAVKTSTSTPPRPGPPTCAAERLISSFEFPSMIWSRSTSDGRYDWYATSKKTWKMPTRKPTTKSCPSVRTSATYAIGIGRGGAPRGRSRRR